MELLTSKTKQCPFCAETIMAQAIKCRYCNEYLNPQRAKAIKTGRDPDADIDPETRDDQPNEDILFAASPSFWAMAPAALKALLILALGAFLMRYHIEDISWLHLSAAHAAIAANYRFLLGLALCILVGLVLLYKAVNLKMMYYEVTADRIEFSRGILDRRIDNLDMFRVIDLKMRRSILDCIVGVGTIVLTTTDKSDPEFTFEKVPYPRDLYDVVKKASLEADKKTNVVHLE